jgi:orotate phosphoribosyltransferase
MGKKVLVKRMIEVGSLKFGEFILSSGKRSNFYVDVKLAITYPDILDKISALFHEKIQQKKLEFDRIACVELGGVPLAVSLSLKTGKPYLIFRKKKKDYGMTTDRIGELRNGDRVLVIEDVTTTGSSALSVVERVREHGCEISGVLVVVDREEGADETLGLKGMRFIPLLTATELLTYKNRI